MSFTQPDGAPVNAVRAAPPLTPAMVDRAEELAKSVGGPVGAEVVKLCIMYRHFHLTPESRERPRPHPSGLVKMTPLSKAEIARIDEHVPWSHEIVALKDLFGTLDPGVRQVGPCQNEVTDPNAKEFNDLAHHLLWYACELALDREPITSDKL